MSLQNLIEDFLYDLLPEGIIDLDEQGLIQAVVGGYQDRVDDLRSYMSKMELLVTGNCLPETDNSGNPVNNVVLCQIQSPQGKIYNKSLDFRDDTPANGDPSLITWAANLLQLDSEHVLISAAYGVDMLRLVDANILAYLASTVGAVLYQTAAMDPNNALSDARRLLKTWFPRLQFKGTSQSFESLGKLLGFDDVRMMPLFGRLSPRIANDIGNPLNDQDFAVVPDYFPKQARDNFYDPWVLNDGPFYTWTGTATAIFGTNDTSFYTEVINGFNPFISVEIIGENPTDPDPAGAPYILVGGGPETQASVSPPGSGLLFTAISAGSSFNGLQINVLPIQNGSYTVLSITDRLSAVKYRSSYYDLAMTLDFNHALALFGTDVATANKDLINNPTLTNFGTAALSPYRPWQSGSMIPQTTVADWLTRTVSTGTLTVIAPRTQADLTSRQFDMDSISAAGAQVVQAMEEVRPATRTPRHVNTGFLIKNQIGYAKYSNEQSIFITQGTTQGTYFGTLSGYPLPPYNVEFLAGTTTGTIPLVGETDLINSGFVRFRSPDLSIFGTYNYSNSTWLFEFLAGVQTGTNIIASYSPTSTEVIRPNPATNSPVNAYQTRPEDFLDTPDAMDFADEYPWRRPLVGGGELVDYDSYSPAQPDVKTVNVGNTVSVVSHTGAQYDVQVIVPGPFPPRFITSERSLDDYLPGQQAIAFTGTFLDLAGTRPSSGTLLGGLDGVLQPGWQLFHFGLVQGVLVSDPKKFYGEHHRKGLALWYPFNEQPLDAIEVLDHSVFCGNAFVTGMVNTDRKFDPVRGNFLSMQPGLALTSPIARGFVQKFAGGFWLRALNGYTNPQTILVSGPLTIKLSGSTTTPQLNFYLVDPSGNLHLQATQTFDQNWVYVSWSFDGIQTLSIYFWNSSGTLIQQTVVVQTVIDFSQPYSFTLLCQNSPYDIQDLRLWNTTKTSSDLALSRYHGPTPTACLYRPAWLQSVNTYDEYAVRVLPSGYVIPSHLPTSIINNKLAWVQRYDYLAEYEAQSRYKQTGIGSGNTPPPKQRLGTQWDTLTADGTIAVSTWTGNSMGINLPWVQDNPIGTALTLFESGSTANGITGTLISTGTGFPWPNALQAVNPCRDRLWVKGDDGFVWEVSLGNTENGNVQFQTQKLFSSSGSYQPTGAHADLTSSILHERLAVKTNGSVYAGTYSGTLTSDSVYLYSNVQTVINLTGTNTFNAWVQPNILGLSQNPPVAALTGNGQIAFQVGQTAGPGFYQLQVTSGNIGKVDSLFNGFDTVITVGDVPFQATLCAGQTGANFSQTDTFTFYLDHTLPGSPSSWLLTFDWLNALNDSQKGTTRQLFISGIALNRFASSLYQVSLGTNTVNLTPLNTAGTNFPIVPGGWMATMTSWGTVQHYTHESQIYSANDTLMNPQPLSNVLGATTAYRREDLIMNGSFTISDPVLPAFTPYGPLLLGPPTITVTPGTLNYGVVPFGVGGTQSFSVFNGGGQELIGSVASVSPPFYVAANGNYDILPGQTSLVEIVFLPPTFGTFTGTITFTGGSNGATNYLQGIQGFSPGPVLIYDTFDTYSTGTLASATSLVGGFGWATTWAAGSVSIVTAADNLLSYSNGTVVTGEISGGSGWNTAAAIL